MTRLKRISPVHYAIAVSSLGAVAGTTFSVMTILAIADIAGGFRYAATTQPGSTPCTTSARSADCPFA